MINFTQWLEFQQNNQNANLLQPEAEGIPQPNQQQQSAPLGNPMPQPQHPQNSEEPIKAMLRTRLKQVFQELEGYKIPRDKQIKLLAHVIGEFQQQLGMNNSSIQRSARMAVNTPVSAA